MIEEPCPWELSRRLIHLGFDKDSVYVWVHPYQSYLYKENKSRYILVDRFAALKREGYPAYSVGEILSNLPVGYVLGRIEGNQWFCKSFSEGWDEVIYYGTPILACAYSAIFMLEQKKGLKKEESEVEEE